jgi:hypothetical protein
MSSPTLAAVYPSGRINSSEPLTAFSISVLSSTGGVGGVGGAGGVGGGVATVGSSSSSGSSATSSLVLSVYSIGGVSSVVTDSYIFLTFSQYFLIESGFKLSI